MKYSMKFIASIVVCLFIVIGLSIWVNTQRLVDIKKDIAPLDATQNTAIFAAFNSEGTVPDYVVDYLKALKEITPNIIYITDNPIKKGEIKKLTPYVNHLEAVRHGEYDWGSYKRGIDWFVENSPSFANKLILANDSVLLVRKSLKPVLQAMPDEVDFYGLTANTDGTYHIQSYFMIFNPEVYALPQFKSYFDNVQSQPDGLTVAYRYEVPFTQFLEGLGFKSATYIPYEELAYLPLNDKNCYPLTLLSKFNLPLLKMRTFTNRLNVQEPRRLVFQWLKKNAPATYDRLIEHLESIHSPYLKDAR